MPPASDGVETGKGKSKRGEKEEEEEEEEDKETETTVACRPGLKGGIEAKKRREWLVQRTHKVTSLATEAIALMILEDYEANVSSDDMIPIGKTGLVNSMFNGVVDGRGSDPEKHPQNYKLQQRVRETFRKIHGDAKPLVPGQGMCQAISLEVKSYVALVKTNLGIRSACHCAPWKECAESSCQRWTVRLFHMV